MGIYDRNYFRGNSGGWGSGPGSWPPVCRAIVVINIGVFIAQILVTRPPTVDEVTRYSDDGAAEYKFIEDYIEIQRRTDRESKTANDTTANSRAENDKPDSESTRNDNSNSDSDDAQEKYRRDAEREYQKHLVDSVVWAPRISPVQEWLQLDTEKIKQGQIWRILTSAFCHDRHSLLHILFNMLGLIWFGIALEYMYGSREFLLFYLASAIISGLAYVALDLYTGDSAPAIGASGAVMGVLMLYACHFPYHTIRIWFFFPLEMRWLVLLYVAFDLHPLLLKLAGDQVYTGVAHAAHLGGLAFGFFYWNQRLKLAPMVDAIKGIDLRKTFRRRRDLKLHTQDTDLIPPTDPETAEQQQLDELLIKISREGRENLSVEELVLLNQASERLRRRKK